jgi:hypothetical protein
VWTTALIITACGAAARAQVPIRSPHSARPQADAAGYFGWFNANKRGTSDYNDWYNRSVLGGLSLGYYWTDHVTTEVEVARTSEGTLVEYTPPAYVPIERAFGNTKVSVSQVYQFGRNSWFHPFVAAGIDVDRERRRQTVLAGVATRPGVVLPIVQPPTDGVFARVGVTTGFKAYMTPRLFFRSDARLAGARRLDQVTWRIGLGLDF